MKILEVAGSGTVGTSNMGPVSTDVFQLSIYFQKLGHKVTIADAVASRARELLPDGIQMVESDCLPHQDVITKTNVICQNRLGRLIQSYNNTRKIEKNQEKFIKELKQKLNVLEFDIVHIHWWRTAAVFVGVRKDFVYTSHTPSWCSSFNYNGIKGGLRRINQHWQVLLGRHEVNIIKRAELTIALGDFLKSVIKCNNIEVIPNGIEVEEWVPGERSLARNAIGIAEDEFVLLFIGRISWMKGVHILIDAMRYLVGKIKNIKLICIGSLSDRYGEGGEATPYAQSLLERSKDLPVNFRGFLSNRTPEFRRYLSAADILVCPSLFENQGTVILEALSMGIPVVGSNVGGIPQMVTEDVGILFRAGDSRDLTAKISYFVENRNVLKVMRDNCRDHIKKHFRWQRTAERHIEAFEQLLSKRV